METQFRKQSANIRKIVEVKDDKGIVKGSLVKKFLTDGVMASRGRWSAWGVDQALAADNLRRLAP